MNKWSIPSWINKFHRSNHGFLSTPTKINVKTTWGRTVSNKGTVHLHVRKRCPSFLRNRITEFPKLVSSFQCLCTGWLCGQSRMFDYMGVTANHLHHTHVYIFAFINSLSWVEMGRKASCMWLGLPNFTDEWLNKKVFKWGSNQTPVWEFLQLNSQGLKQDKDLLSD